MKNNKLKQDLGFSLMEVMVSLFIIMILFLGIFSLIQLSLKITADNARYVEAIEIANQKMEQIRNLPYKDVGVISGIPGGIVPQVETVSREGLFRVNNYITYYDDDYDGLAGSSTPDTIPTDYKIATVKVSWQSQAGEKHVTVFSKIIPRTVETNEGYGLLKIYVGDADAQPVANANVRVVNNLVVPAIDVVNLTNSQGLLYLPATSSAQGYEITVTKTDEEPLIYYGEDRTYNPATSKSPFHLSVSEGNMAEESFTIDRLADLQVRTVSANLPENFRVNEPVAGKDQKAVQFASDNADNMYFAWHSQASSSSYVYVQKYDSSEAKQWAGDIKISTTEYEAKPDIAVTGAGNSFVVWQDNSKTLKAITYSQPSTRLASRFKNNPLPAMADPGIFTKNKIPSQIILANDFFSGNSSPSMAFNSLPFFKTQGLFNNFNPIQLLKNQLSVYPAQAAGAIVQSKISPVENSANTLSATFNNPPTAGNVLIAIGMHRNWGNSFSPPYNAGGAFTESVYSDSIWYLDVGIWHKVAGAGEPSQVWLDNDGDIDGGIMIIMEVSGLDTSNLLDVTSSNDQTGSNSNTADTGLSGVSTAQGLAIAAIGWGDDNFNTPDSSDWSSASANVWSHQFWEDWPDGNSGSLGVAIMDIDAADSQSAALTTTGGGAEQRNSVLAIYNLYMPDNITVSATGTQIASTTKPQNNHYAGGAFVFTDNTGAHNINSIAISEYGTIDAQNDLDNIKLFYEYDTSAPYDCASESYGGSEAQYGSTLSSGFSSADGQAVFTGTADISTVKTMCVYAVFDVLSSAAGGDNIKIKISDPPSEVAIDSGSVLPGSSVFLNGSTLVNAEARLQQIHYGWRNDDGSEISATWAEAEDQGILMSSGLIRLRFAVNNGGTLDSAPCAYQLEYGEKVTTCGAIGAWTALPFDDTKDWRMAASANFTDGDATTNSGGISDENLLFATGEIKDSGSQTSAIVLTGLEFTEIEYAIMPTAGASDNPYCFRLSNAGSTANFEYLEYPEATIIGDNNIYIVSLDANGNKLWGEKRVNADIAGEEQSEPEIAITENFGQATATIVWQDERSGNSDIYAQIIDNSGNKILGGDLQVTASGTEEFSPHIAFDSNDNFFIVWVDGAVPASKIYMQKYRLSDQSGWSNAKGIVSSVFDVYDPEIAVDASDNVYLAYTELAAGIENVYLAKYNNNGELLWEKQANLEENSYDQHNPSLALNISEIYVSWTDNRNGNEDVYVQKYDLSGNALWAKDLRVNITADNLDQSDPALLINSANIPYAAWQDERNGAYDIYATEFSDPWTVAGKANVPIRIWGTKTISETPVVYEYDETFYTDASGYADLQIEWDTPGYQVELVSASTSLNKILVEPSEPLELMPGDNINWQIYVE